jgi:thioredoxin reductase (NADPH)
MAWRRQAAGVMGTPRVDFFYKKERVQMMNGVKMKTEYRNVIEQYVK